MNKIFLFGIFILFSICSINIHWKGDNWKSIINSNIDSRGYYAYLPAIFIYHDLSFGFIDSLNKSSNLDLIKNDFIINTPKGSFDKYYFGRSFAELPFFLIAHCIVKFVNDDASGYSKIYFLFISLAGIIFCIFGLYYLSKL